MLLVIDIGNTNTSLGVFDGQALAAHWRLTTVRARTVDEWGVLARNLFALAELDFKVIDAIAVASVAAGLIGWFVSTATGSGAPAPVPAGSHVASQSSSPAAGTVTVDSSALIGQPVSIVRDTLLGLGLRPQVNLVAPTDQWPDPGTVVSVEPSGQVPVGATVTVTAVQSHDQGHGNGDNGNGN